MTTTLAVVGGCGSSRAATNGSQRKPRRPQPKLFRATQNDFGWRRFIFRQLPYWACLPSHLPRHTNCPGGLPTTRQCTQECADKSCREQICWQRVRQLTAPAGDQRRVRSRDHRGRQRIPTRALPSVPLSPSLALPGLITPAPYLAATLRRRAHIQGRRDTLSLPSTPPSPSPSHHPLPPQHAALSTALGGTSNSAARRHQQRRAAQSGAPTPWPPHGGPLCLSFQDSHSGRGGGRVASVQERDRERVRAREGISIRYVRIGHPVPPRGNLARPRTALLCARP